jgi:hypothetical protein
MDWFCVLLDVIQHFLRMWSVLGTADSYMSHAQPEKVKSHEDLVFT